MRSGTLWLSRPAEDLAGSCETRLRLREARAARAVAAGAATAAPAAPMAPADEAAAPVVSAPACDGAPSDEEAPCFDVIVVGSGYGGAVAAARLAALSEAGEPLKVCVLERGREYQPGDFPDRLEQLPGYVRFTLDRPSHAGADAEPDAGAKGVPHGLFDFKLAGDVSALVANGLGGGSLINAGVAEECDAATLQDPAWPAPWNAAPALWGRLYARARSALHAAPWVGNDSRKAVGMHGLAEQLSGQSRAVHLTIEPPVAWPFPATPPRRPCVECGDCFTGCNHGAKLTLSHSYLRTAAERGASLLTGATVMSVAPLAKKGKARWSVRCVLADAEAAQRPFELHARHVVLSAGTFGSTEILMRSRAAGLALSSRLGTRFSANGDTIGAYHETPDRMNAVADEDQPLAQRRVGPTITSMIDLRGKDAPAAQRLVVQDLAVPGALGWMFKELLTTQVLPHRWTRADWRCHRPGDPDPHAVDDRGSMSPMQRSLLVTTFGHDGAKGNLVPMRGFESAHVDGSLAVRWRGVGEEPCFMAADKTLKAAVKGGAMAGATWLRNPMWQAVPDSPLLELPRKRRIVTTHPLGGCPMAGDVSRGVVDAHGRVFDPGSKDGVHEGLYVLDGSIVPTSLGINPLLTITALAEGAVDEWLRMAKFGCAQVHGKPSEPLLAYPAAQPPVRAGVHVGVQAGEGPARAAHEPVPTRVVFTERMSGPLLCVPPQRGSDPHRGARLSLICDFDPIADLQAFLRLPEKMLGLKARLEVTAAQWLPGDLRTAPELRSSDTVHLHAARVWWFEQETVGVARRFFRTLCAWARHRAAADLAERLLGPAPGVKQARSSGGPAGAVWALLKAFTHFGAPRLLRYDFGTLVDDWAPVIGSPGMSFPRGTQLFGCKRLVYTAEADPWRQLTQMTLQARKPDGEVVDVAKLAWDPLYMLDRDRLPLEVLQQSGGVAGLRDTVSLALYFARVVAGTHFPSFRGPVYEGLRPRKPLPWLGPGPAAAQRIFGSFELDRFSTWTEPAGPDGKPRGCRLVLSRIRLQQQHRSGAPAEPVPVLMLHGLGSSGVQYTHPAIEHPMALSLAQAGREVWVGELRTSIALASSRKQWSMDDVAGQDVPALMHKVLAESLQDQLDVVAHCIGSAMFCMAALSGRLYRKDEHGGLAVKNGRPVPMVRRAALMQVGPVVHLPPTNRLRGYLGHRAQQWLALDRIASTTDDRRANDMDRLIDRVAGTYSFLAGRKHPAWDDGRRSNPLPLRASVRANIRRGHALRSAAVFGQLFQMANMQAPELLDALPDMLGEVNLTTYQQTVFYTFERRLTDRSGDNVYVTDRNIREHFDFPVLWIQGGLNDTFDRRGTLESARLIQRVRDATAAAPAAPVYRLEVEGYGHLDCVVGAGSRRKVHLPIIDFLATLAAPACIAADAASAAPSAAARQLKSAAVATRRFRSPAFGPWIGQARLTSTLSAPELLQLRLGLKLEDTQSADVCVASVVMAGDRMLEQTLRLHVLPVNAAAPSHPSIPTASLAAFWKEGEAVLEVELQPAIVSPAGAPIEVVLCSLSRLPSGDSAASLCTEWSRQRDTDGTRLLRERDDVQPIDSVRIEPAWLDALRDRSRIRFALGSCRQTPLLLDRRMADACFAGMAEPRHGPLAYTLLVGDQIYADALAMANRVPGLRGRFADAHREAWVAPHQREWMRSRPVMMALDDHEFENDYQARALLAPARKKVFAAAQSSWWRYQLAAGPAGSASAAGGIQAPENSPAWYRFEQAGFHTFVCDTRGTRTEDRSVDRRKAAMLGHAQSKALRDWLNDRSLRSRRARFLVLPSPLFPLQKGDSGEAEHALRCDGWQRFPKSMGWLLMELLNAGDPNIVLLSGDYHCHVDLTAWVSLPNVRRVEFRCILTSGLYCPYEVANTRRSELLDAAEIRTATPGGPTAGYKIDCFAEGSGWTRVEADDQGRVLASFVPAPDPC